MQVIVDGLLTNYSREGKGKIVIILHGWGDDLRSWRFVSESLSKTYQVILLDLPGFGGTQSPNSPWGLSDYASFIAAFLRKLDVNDLYAVIGHSNGGAIAIRGCADAELKPEKLVLISSAGLRGEYNGRIKAMRMVTKAGRAITSPLPKSVKQKLRKQVYKSIGSDMLVAEHLQDTFKKIVTDDVRDDATRIQVPTLLLYGAQDEQTPPYYGQTFKDLIRDSRLILYSKSGHFLQIDRPTEIIKAIREFIS